MAIVKYVRCTFCNKKITDEDEMYFSRDINNKYDRFYCSEKCMHDGELIWKVKAKDIINNFKYNDRVYVCSHIINCDECGKKMFSDDNVITLKVNHNDTKHFCSLECANKKLGIIKKAKDFFY